jgi:hypothetical protein
MILEIRERSRGWTRMWTRSGDHPWSIQPSSRGHLAAIRLFIRASSVGAIQTSAPGQADSPGKKLRATSAARGSLQPVPGKVIPSRVRFHYADNELQKRRCLAVSVDRLGPPDDGQMTPDSSWMTPKWRPGDPLTTAE